MGLQGFKSRAAAGAGLGLFPGPLAAVHGFVTGYGTSASVFFPPTNSSRQCTPAPTLKSDSRTIKPIYLQDRGEAGSFGRRAGIACPS